MSRSVVPGIPYHVVQRASQQRFILDDDRDKAVLLKNMVTWQAETGLAIAAFVVMGNHFHLVASSPTPTALCNFMGRVCGEFSRYLNVRRGTRGPNWQGRYYAAPMDPGHTVAAIRYVERNPVAAGLVSRAWEWRWSSAAWHAGMGPRPRVLTADFRAENTPPAVWRALLEDALDTDTATRLKQATLAGRGLGTKEWVEQLDAQLGRPPAQPLGRPKQRDRAQRVVGEVPAIRSSKGGTPVPGTTFRK